MLPEHMFGHARVFLLRLAGARIGKRTVIMGDQSFITASS